MRISTHFCDAQQWAQRHFGTVAVGDVRRRRRVYTLAAGWARQPGASIPQLGAGVAYASKAAYQLLNQPRATPEVLQAPHRELVHTQLQQPGTYLLVEDTTQLRWSWSSRPRPGPGPVAATKQAEQGVLLHSLVALRWPPPRWTPPARLSPCSGCSTSSITCASPSPSRSGRIRTAGVDRARDETANPSSGFRACVR